MKRSIWGIGIVTLLSCVAAACSPASPADMVAEEAVIDQALWKASLDQAVAEAIWDHLDVKETYPESFCCEDHYILDIRDSEGESLEGEQEEPCGLWMIDILYETNHEIMPDDGMSTGQEFFERYLAEAQELESAYGMEWMKENEPYKWELLTMLQEIEQ